MGRFLILAAGFLLGFAAHWGLVRHPVCENAGAPRNCERLWIDWLKSRIAPSPRGAVSVTFDAALRADGLAGPDGSLPAGEGPQQFYKPGAPVRVTVGLAPDAGAAPLEFALPGGEIVTLDAGWSLTFAVAVGGDGAQMAMASLVDQRNLTRAALIGNTIVFASENNTIDRIAEAGDAFAYIELIHSLSVTSSARDAESIRTGADLQAFLSSASTTGGRFDFRYCDESLLGRACPPRSDPGLPFSTILSF